MIVLVLPSNRSIHMTIADLYTSSRNSASHWLGADVLSVLTWHQTPFCVSSMQLKETQQAYTIGQAAACRTTYHDEALRKRYETSV